MLRAPSADHAPFVLVHATADLDHAPFALRSTFQPMQETRFDGYYFQGNFNKILGLDTQITEGGVVIPMTSVYDAPFVYRLTCSPRMRSPSPTV